VNSRKGAKCARAAGSGVPQAADTSIGRNGLWVPPACVCSEPYSLARVFLFLRSLSRHRPRTVLYHAGRHIERASSAAPLRPSTWPSSCSLNVSRGSLPVAKSHSQILNAFLFRARLGHETLRDRGHKGSWSSVSRLSVARDTQRSAGGSSPCKASSVWAVCS
jgi:hypothetical protein